MRFPRFGSSVPRSTRQGSILLLVLVLLAVLGLFTTMILYSSRLESMAAANAGMGVQANVQVAASNAVVRDRLEAQVGLPTDLRAIWSDVAAVPTAAPVPAGEDSGDSSDDRSRITERLEELTGEEERLREEFKDEALDDGLSRAEWTELEQQIADVQLEQRVLRAQLRRLDNPGADDNPTGESAARAFVAWLDGNVVQDQAALLPLNAVEPYVDTKSKTPQSVDRSTEAGQEMPRVYRRLPAESLEKLVDSVLGKSRAVGGYSASEIARNILDTGETIRSERARARQRRVEEQSAGRAGSSRSSTQPDAEPAATPVSGNVEDLGPDVPDGALRGFEHESDLRAVPGMTTDLYEALAPWLAAYSTSLEVWQDAEGDTYARTPINKATAEQIFKTLRVARPDLPEATLAQFAVNIVDRRDGDSVPTTLNVDGRIEPVIGFELTPFISEVCPSVMSLDEQDSGEYIEIHNPLADPVEISGWRLDWGAGSVELTGALPPEGVMIVTDNINGNGGSRPAGSVGTVGSFYDVFHAVPYTSHQSIAEMPGMQIPNASGVVRLSDAQGRLIDLMAYSGGAFNGINRGFRRVAPASSEVCDGAASPFEARDLTQNFDSYERQCWQILVERMDKPFVSVAELLTVPAPDLGLKEVKGRTRALFPRPEVTDRDEALPWDLDAAMRKAAERSLDLCVLDCFTVEDIDGPFDNPRDTEPRTWPADPSERLLAEAASETDEPANVEPARGRDESRRGRDNERFRPAGDDEPSPERSRLTQRGDSRAPEVAGKINLNTAPLEVLDALPILGGEMAARIVQYRESVLQQPVEEESAADGEDSPERPARTNAPFASLSEFAGLPEIWQGVAPDERLKMLLAVAPLLTVNSSAFKVRSANVINEQAPDADRQSLASCESLIALGADGVQVLRWGYRYEP